MKESSIERRVSHWCDQHKILHAKFSPMGRAGWPDHIYFVPGGLPILIEFKAPGKTPTKIQRHYLKKLREMNYDAVWGWSAEEAIKWIERRCANPTNTKSAE